MIKPLVKLIVTTGIAGTILVILFEFFVMPWYVRQGQEIYIPDIKGMSSERALREIETEGFKGVIYDTLYTNIYTPETIVDQFPAPYKKVKLGRTIRLKIAKPEKLVLVPILIGQSRRSAEIILDQLGLKIDTVYTEFNPDYPKGTVAWQFPKPGNQLKKGLGLQITISKGMPPDFFQVPQLFGLSLSQARETLKKSRLKVGKITYRQNEELLPTTVLDQSIPPGTVLDQSRAVNLVVSILDLQDIFDQLTTDK